MVFYSDAMIAERAPRVGEKRVRVFLCVSRRVRSSIGREIQKISRQTYWHNYFSISFVAKQTFDWDPTRLRANSSLQTFVRWNYHDFLWNWKSSKLIFRIHIRIRHRPKIGSQEILSEQRPFQPKIPYLQWVFGFCARGYWMNIGWMYESARAMGTCDGVHTTHSYVCQRVLQIDVAARPKNMPKHQNRK